MIWKEGGKESKVFSFIIPVFEMEERRSEEKEGEEQGGWGLCWRMILDRSKIQQSQADV